VLGKPLFLVVLLVATFAFVATTEERAEAAWNCTGTDIRPGDDIDAKINQDEADTPTRFCVYAGKYTVSEVARLKDGDTLDAEPGSLDYVGPATKPTPKVKLVGSGTENLLSALGSDITIKWVDLSGASGTGQGTGSAIAAGSADSKLLVQYSRIHNNDSVGISNMHGRVLDSEFFENSESSASIGFNGSAIKGITQFEAGRLYVHDEQGNGIWCDAGCDRDSDMTHGFWVYDSVVVRSDRAGIRYENSDTGALIENNEIHENGLNEKRGGIDIRDSQHATVSNNNFGPETIAGVNYEANGDNIGVRATGSGRSDRVNLADIHVDNNKLNGDRIVSCGGPVSCSNNAGGSTLLSGSSLRVFSLPDPSAFMAKEFSTFSKRVFFGRSALQPVSISARTKS
jgi:hypothetical protein